MGLEMFITLLRSLLRLIVHAKALLANFSVFQFFTTKPLPCDPSSLPKYPPSKEFDVKLRDDDRR